MADTVRGIRVFDMGYLFDLQESPKGDTSDKSGIGWGGAGAYGGFGYRYVMPQVDAWVNAAGPDAGPGEHCPGAGAPKFSYMASNRRARAGELIVGRPDATPTGSLQASETRPAGIGPEDLSYWPAQERLWTVTEFAGRRMLYGVPG